MHQHLRNPSTILSFLDPFEMFVLQTLLNIRGAYILNIGISSPFEKLCKFNRPCGQLSLPWVLNRVVVRQQRACRSRALSSPSPALYSVFGFIHPQQTGDDIVVRTWCNRLDPILNLLMYKLFLVPASAPRLV